ncbi:hypothetical protein SAMN02982931_04596 [Bauldia litoralis]|uniref:Uncharacterized protein n=2 Tax=Bauldia litoralis TaxID=665467 RepID=A0A1G6EJU9_9HYPH|nr:hypothetical protein SAMN02982931_04596 [Bauldia litoralis]
MTRGRKRKPGKRHPCGKRIRQETEKEAMSTVIEARKRHYGVTARQARDERLGTAFGRLAFHGLISDEQYQAGLAFAELYRRHHVAMGLPMPSPRSVAGILINEGIFGGSPGEPGLDVIERLRRRFDDATDALDQCDREHRLSPGRRPTLLVYRVLCVDEDTRRWPDEDIGNLRVALNALVRVFRLERR